MGYSKGLHNGGNQRGKPILLILLMIFGAALLGVMVLHRFREKRIYNLIVKEKDHQLLVLQVLLQVQLLSLSLSLSQTAVLISPKDGFTIVSSMLKLKKIKKIVFY
jgi:hypothetical protein